MTAIIAGVSRQSIFEYVEIGDIQQRRRASLDYVAPLDEAAKCARNPAVRFIGGKLREPRTP